METVYHIIPSGGRSFYILLPFVVLLVVAMTFLGRTLYGSQHASFVVSDAGLDFRGDVYGKPLAWAELLVDSARIVDLAREPSLRPRARRVGTALPGYNSGWYTLQSGEKALLYVSARDRVVYLPTTRGYSVLLSPDAPDAMLAELKRRGAAHRGS